MKKKFKNTYSLLKYLVKEYGSLEFEMGATPYGTDLTSDFPIGITDELEDALRKFEMELETKYELELGSEQSYKIAFTENELNVFIHCKWEYSYLGTKNSSRDLELILEDAIEAYLCQSMSISLEEFQQNHYFVIAYSSDAELKPDAFVLYLGEHEEAEMMSSEVIAGLRKLIDDLSQKFGANTDECECAFDYYLSRDNSSIIERWTEHISCSEVFMDKRKYELEV
jgi:hypothetical protein